MAYEYSTRRYRNWYAKLLRFYPKPFRECFGEGMEQTFNDLCQKRKEAGEGLFVRARIAHVCYTNFIYCIKTVTKICQESRKINKNIKKLQDSIDLIRDSLLE